MDTAWLMSPSLFSLVGFAVLVYGRKQRRGAPTLTGVLLMLYSYFVDSAVAVIAIGILLLIAMVVASRMEDSL